MEKICCGGFKLGNGLDLDDKVLNVEFPQAANVAKAAGSAPTKAEFDALINALVASGLMAEAAE